MRKLLLFIALMAVSCSSFAQVKLENIVVPGTKLLYGVDAGGKKYDFIVTVKQLTPVVIFDWEMTAPVGISGTIIHTEEGMKSATSLYNFFGPGTKKLDDESVSVWLSKAIFYGVLNGRKGISMHMNVGDEAKTMGTYGGSKSNEILVDGVKQKVDEEIVKEIKDGDPTGSEDFFTFYYNAKLPIIMRMNAGFYIWLKEVKTK